MAKAKTQIDGLSHKFLRNNNEIRVISNYKTLDDISGYRAISLSSDGEVKAGDHFSSNIIGFQAGAKTTSAGKTLTAVVEGPAYAYPQSRIDIGLPIKAAEAGRITHGVQKVHSGRVIIAATAGQDDEVTSESANQQLDVVSDTTDITQVIKAYVKIKTTGVASMLTGTLNGTTAVVLYDVNGTAQYADELYGAEISAASAGTITLANVTSSTALATFTSTATQSGVTSMTTPNNAACRPVKITFNQQMASTELFLIGTDYTGAPQYEIITHDGSGQLVYQSANSYRTLDAVADGIVRATATATTYAINSLATNEFVVDWVNMEDNITYTGNTQTAQKVQIHSDVNTGIDLSGASVVIYGDEAGTLRYETVALTGTTPASTTGDYDTIHGAFISVGNPVGLIVVEKEDTTDLFSFDALTLTAAGMFGPEGHETSATAPHALYDIPGCNSRPTFTLSNTSATDEIYIVGEDVDGTTQREVGALVDGVFTSIYTWSRIQAVFGVTIDNTEYLTISFEEEDDGQEFCGFAAGLATAQSTTSKIPIWVRSAFGAQYGTSEDEMILQVIRGTTGVTNLSSIASATRAVVFPDAAGTVALTSGTISITSNIHTVGAGMDYATCKLAIAGATAGDTLWCFLSTDTTITGSTIFSKRLNVIGFGDGGTTLTSAFTTDATVDITADGCEFHNIIFDCSGNGAASIALNIVNSGAKFFNCSFDGGTNAAGIAIDISANGADILEFTNCKVNDGIIDADGNANSILYWRGGIIADAINLDTGTYHFSDLDINAAFTTGASVGASVYLDNVDISGALTITKSDAFNMSGGIIGGAVSLVAGTYIDLSGVKITGTTALSGIITEAYFRNCDLTGTYSQSTAAQSVYANDTRFTGVATINHASAVFEANDCQFGGNLINTASASLKLKGGSVAGALTLSTGTLHEISNALIVGACSIVNSTYLEFADCKFTANIAMTGVVAESYIRDCDIGTTFSMATAKQVVDIHDSIITGIATINHASAEFNAYDCSFGSNLVSTDSNVFNIKGGSVGGLLTLTAGTSHIISDVDIIGVATLVASTYADISKCRFTTTFAQSGVVTEAYIRDCDFGSTFGMLTSAGSIKAYDSRFTGHATINHASAVFEAHDCNFVANAVCTSAAAFKIKGGNVGGVLTLTAGTLHEISDATLTGAVSLVASTYADISNSRLGASLAVSGVVAESYIRDCDITSTYAQTGAASVEFHNVRQTGTSTINQAGADFKAFDSHLIGNVLFTDADLVEIRNCTIDGTTNIDAGTLYNISDSEFTGVVVQDGGTSVIYANNCLFTAVFTNNNAGADFFAEGCRFTEGITDAAGTYGIVELKDCILNATANSIVATLVGTSFDIYNSVVTNLIDHNGGTISIYGSQLKEIDQDGGTLNMNRCSVSGAIASAGTALNDVSSTITGILARASGTVTLQDTYLIGTATGTIAGNYTQYNAGYKLLGEGGQTKQAKKFICGGITLTDEQLLTIAGGAVLDNDNTTQHVAWAVGDLAGGAATRGYWDMDGVTEMVTVSIPLPDLAVDTGTAADFRVGFRVDPTNADDTIDYAIYDQAGAHLVDETVQTMSGGAAEHTHWVNLGALSWSKGDALIVAVGNFQVAATGAVDVKLYWIEYDFKVGIENDTA